MDAGEVPPEKQAAPPKLSTEDVWQAFQNDAKRAGMITYGGSKDGISVADLVAKAEADQ